MPLRLLSVLGLLVALVVLPLAAPAEENGALATIIKVGVVKIAVPDNFAPFGTLDPDGKLQGYDIDTAALVAGVLGVKPKLVAVPSTERIPTLTDGKVDLVISTLGKNAEREKLIDFSTAYAPFFSAVFGPKDFAVTKPDDLAGKSIAVTKNTIEDAALTKLAPSNSTIKRYDDNAATEVAFLSNQTELIATGNAVAVNVLTKSLVKKTAMKFVLRNSPCYIGVGKEQPDLLARIDAILAAARTDGRLDAISQKWLKTPLGDPEHPDLASVK